MNNGKMYVFAQQISKRRDSKRQESTTFEEQAG
jgi:hypothetical protein